MRFWIVYSDDEPCMCGTVADVLVAVSHARGPVRITAAIRVGRFALTL